MLRVEIAESGYKQAQGLMFRKSMPDDTGMIFVFKKADHLGFWGVNTFIPLDIAFVDSNNVITQISSITPLSEKTVRSEAKCNIAIEANLGYFADNRIYVGDKIDFKRSSNDVGHVEFYGKNSIKTAQFIGTKNEGSKGVNVQPQYEDVAPTQAPTQPNPDMQPATPPNPENAGLPVIDISNLAGILEDSYDEEQGPGEEEIAPPEDIDQAPVDMQPQPEMEEREQEPFPIPDEEYPDFGTPQEALTWAEQNKEVIRIWYKTKGGRDIERNVEPHGQFVAESTGNPIVVTFDETIGDIRAFIVSNVLFFSFIGEEFTPKFTVRR